MDALTPQQVPEARFVLTYQQRNITHDISQHLLSLTYSDYLSGQADSLDIELEDTDGKWLGAWYPGHGDTLTLSIGWHGQALRALGSFEIDEIELNCPPSTVSIRALGAGINKSLRTTEHQAYENTTLDAVAKQIAARQGLVLVGCIEPIKLKRLTQQEADLTFLRNLADDYDYAFKVTGNRLVFHAISELAKAQPVATQALKDLSGVRLRDTFAPKAVQVKYKDPAKKQLVTYTIINGETVAVPSSASATTTSGDTQKQRKRAASAEVAKAKAKADLAKAKRQQTIGSWTAMGQPNLVSGNVVSLVAAGQLGGNYLITAATHRVTRSGGYTISKNVCRLSTPSINSQPDLALLSYGMASEVMV